MTNLLDDLAEVVRLDGPDGRYDASCIKALRFIRTHAAEIERNARDAKLLAEAERLVTKAIGKHGVQFEIQFAPLVVSDGTLREYLMRAIDTAMRAK